MMSNRRTITMLAVVAPLAMVSTFASDLAVDWYTIDGGGEMWCSGGDYELSGTIGQPDANTTVMAGGDFKLTGGFWAPFAAHVKPVPPESLEPADDALEPAAPEPVPPP
jgi:hypothetical protein